MDARLTDDASVKEAAAAVLALVRGPHGAGPVMQGGGVQPDGSLRFTDALGREQVAVTGDEIEMTDDGWWLMPRDAEDAEEVL